MRKEYSFFSKSSNQDFLISYYLLLRYYFYQKRHNKKIKNSLFGKKYLKYIKTNLKITDDWFTHNLNNLNYVFEKYELYKKKINALEIGSYEGNSSVFFLKYFLNLNLTCVDTFRGSAEHKDKTFTKAYKNFIFNTKKYKKRLRLFKTQSDNFFKNINKAKYDLIYIDGSHYSKDVLNDALDSFKVLNKGGLIIFDDFMWDYFKKINDNPIGGIKIFFKKKFFEVKILSISYQIILQKL